MRRAMWMALAFVGTPPLAAVAQQQGVGVQQRQTAAGPTGAASLEQGQDTAGTQGSFGVFGLPALPGLNGVPLQNTTQTGEWWQGGTGGSGMSGSIGPTYRGTTPLPSSSSSGDTDTNASPPAASNPNTNASGDSGGQGDLARLRQRVDSLEREVSSLRGTGGSGAAADDSRSNVQANPSQTGRAQANDTKDSEPVALVTVEFDGTVRGVSDKHIDVVDRTDGTLSRLTIDDQTRAFRGSPRKQIPLKQITEGTRVQTSFAYISGVEHARDIVVRSSPGKVQQ